jgi:intracellular multiplication protein IcmC
VPDIQAVLTNISNIIVPLTALTLTISFMTGVFFIFQGLMALKNAGQNIGTATQSQTGEMSGPMMKLLIGAILIYLPSSTDTLSNSLFNTGSSLFGSGSISYQNLGVGSTLLGYGGGNSFGQQWASLANTLVLYIQFIGLLSMLKGWFILAESAGHNAQQGTVAKGFTHVIGGIIAMNFVTAITVINNTIFGT